MPQEAPKRKQEELDRQDNDSTTQHNEDAPPAKKAKPSATAALPSVAKPITAAGLSSLKKAKKDPSQRTKPVSRRHERTPPRARDPSPAPISRSPSRSPPRQRKRPGLSGRIPAGGAEAVRRRQEERERQFRDQNHQRLGTDAVSAHYNAVPERGREWRQTGSKIKGLRSFNNWVKSALIQRCSPNESYTPGARQSGRRYEEQMDGLRVLDIGCGKGGDLQKWQNAPQGVDVYVGLDPAAVSVDQARDRYLRMPRTARGGEFAGRRLFHAEFMVKDCFGESLEDIPIIRQIGIDFTHGPAAQGGGFDVVSMMFCMHYAFENEQRARGMLKNVAATLRKGGRFLGVIPNSDVLSAKVKTLADGDKATTGTTNGSGGGSTARSSGSEEGEWNPEQAPESALTGMAHEDDDDWDPEKPSDPQLTTGDAAPGPDEEDDDWDPERPSEPAAAAVASGDSSSQQKTATPLDNTAKTEGPLEWGNSMYRVKFPGSVPKTGIFRPSYGWKYFFFLEEAVEEVPEYVVPWEAFRAMAIEYDLELQYRKPFLEVWSEDKNDPVLGELSERMGVRDRNGQLLVSKDELEASSFYHSFCFIKQ